MAKKEKILVVNIVVFSLILLIHLLRIIINADVKVNGWQIPFILNWVAIVILAVLIYSNYKVLR